MFQRIADKGWVDWRPIFRILLSCSMGDTLASRRLMDAAHSSCRGASVPPSQTSQCCWKHPTSKPELFLLLIIIQLYSAFNDRLFRSRLQCKKRPINDLIEHTKTIDEHALSPPSSSLPSFQLCESSNSSRKEKAKVRIRQ